MTESCCVCIVERSQVDVMIDGTSAKTQINFFAASFRLENTRENDN
jgi:hypothetical protein